MSAIKLMGGFSVIPKGFHILKITKAEYKEKFGKLEITLENSKGQKHIERFSLIDSKKQPNEPAIKAFSYLARTAMGNFDLEEVEPSMLIGKFIGAIIEHEVVPSKNDPTKNVTFSRISEKFEASGFDDATSNASASTASETKVAADKPKSYDLNALLGGL